MRTRKVLVALAGLECAAPGSGALLLPEPLAPLEVRGGERRHWLAWGWHAHVRRHPLQFLRRVWGQEVDPLEPGRVEPHDRGRILPGCTPPGDLADQLVPLAVG